MLMQMKNLSVFDNAKVGRKNRVEKLFQQTAQNIK